MLNEGIEALQGFELRTFVQIAMSIHEEGMVQTKRWLRRLCHAGLAEELEQAFHERSSRSRSWVSMMVLRCQMVLRAGEELEVDREKWGSTGTVPGCRLSRLRRKKLPTSRSSLCSTLLETALPSLSWFPFS
jgi:hypothetical protein